MAEAQPPVQPGVQSGAQLTEQGGTKLALSRHQVEILIACRESQPLTVLMTIAGRSDRTKFRNQVMGPLLTMGLLEMTIPDKRRSSRQRYRLTQAGIEHLAKIEEKKESIDK